jgi:hypothetical protein
VVFLFQIVSVVPRLFVLLGQIEIPLEVRLEQDEPETETCPQRVRTSINNKLPLNVGPVSDQIISKWEMNGEKISGDHVETTDSRLDSILRIHQKTKLCVFVGAFFLRRVFIYYEWCVSWSGSYGKIHPNVCAELKMKERKVSCTENIQIDVFVD